MGRTEGLKTHIDGDAEGSETITVSIHLLSTSCSLAPARKTRSFIFTKDWCVMGPLLGPEDTEINIEIVLILRSSRGVEEADLKICKRDRESRGHSLGAGETLGSLCFLGGLWTDE